MDNSNATRPIPSVSSNQFTNKPKAIIIIIALIITIIVQGYFLLRINFIYKKNLPVVSADLLITPTPSVVNNNEFVKLPESNPNNNILNEAPIVNLRTVNSVYKHDSEENPYPKNLLNLWSKNEDTIKCTESYIPRYEDKKPHTILGYFVEKPYTQSGQEYGNKLDSDKILEFLNMMNNHLYISMDGGMSSGGYIYRIDRIMYCTVATDIIYEVPTGIFIYDVQQNGGGAGLMAYIQHEYEPFPVDGISVNAPYGSCQFLFGDKDSNMYFNCSGGDGNYGYSSYKKYNLKTRKITEFK